MADKEPANPFASCVGCEVDETVRQRLRYAQRLGIGEHDEGEGRVQPRAVRWQLLTDPVGQRLLELHKRFIQLRKQYPALRSPNFYPRFYDEGLRQLNSEGYGVHEEKDLLIYHRWAGANNGQLERFIIVLNLSAYDQYIDIPFSVNDTWVDQLDGGVVQISGFRLVNQKINSHWWKFYHQTG
jgi:hypothetical protein